MQSVETIVDLEGVLIQDNGEPLVDLRAACPGVLVGEQPLYARQGVAARLNVVQEWLDIHHSGCRLRVGDAYRSPSHQARLFGWALLVARLLHPFHSAGQVREAANRYVAAPDTLAPAPHTTGGAVDVALVDANGRRAYMGPFTPAATRTDYPRLNALAATRTDYLSSFARKCTTRFRPRCSTDFRPECTRGGRNFCSAIVLLGGRKAHLPVREGSPPFRTPTVQSVVCSNWLSSSSIASSRS